MSIVGTRPPLISETNLYEPHHKARGVLCHKPCGDSVTAYGILRQRGKGT